MDALELAIYNSKIADAYFEGKRKGAALEKRRWAKNCERLQKENYED